MTLNLYFEKLKKYDSKIAIIYKGVSYSYNDLFNEISNMEILVRDQIKKNQVVGILSDYSFKSISLFFALFKNNNIIVPITSEIETEITDRIEEGYIDYVIKLTDNNIIINNSNKQNENHALISQLIEEDKPGLILFSSGSTGKPKTMLHDLNNMLSYYLDKNEKYQIMLVFLMFDHIGGLNTLFNSLAMGSTMVIPENRDAKYICKLIEQHKIQILPSSPTFLNLILISEAYNDYNLDSVTLITYGTEPMSETLLNKLQSVFKNVKFLQTFGTSETGITKTSSKSSDSTLIKINDPNTEYKIVEGELWLKSKTTILGYLNASMDNFTIDGWYKTGDLVEQFDDGYIKIVGRIKELVNVGGLKVLPEEVERYLLEIPEILDCMVYGEKNVITGQSVACEVVLKNDDHKSSIRKIIREHCFGKIDNYKIPTKIIVVDKTNFSDRFKKIRRK